MTGYEIAKLAGVSVMTVSRVINGSPNVAENTRKKIQEIVDKYGYTPNPMARNLAGKESNVIGLYLADINSDEKNNIPSYEAPYFLSFISSIIGYANKNNHKILVNIINNEDQFQEIEQDFKNRTISGGIFLGFENGTPLITKLAEENFKMVLLDQDPNLFKNTNSLIFADIDDEGASFNVVKYLTEIGHTKIAHIRHTTKRLSSTYRYKGYFRGLQENNAEINLNYVAIGKGTESGSYHAMQDIINNSKNDLPTAVFAGTDLMASYAIKAIQDSGLNVPEDISVVGYDDTYLAKYSNPSITSVNVPIPEISKFAVENLINMIKGLPYTKEYKFETTLVVRDSTRKLK